MNKPKLFYRVTNPKTEQGLWYDMQGNFTGLIHGKFSFCRSSSLQMPYDPDVVGWLSATESLVELMNWFPPEDLTKLKEHGYVISAYEATEYKVHDNHWVIKQDSSKLIR